MARQLTKNKDSAKSSREIIVTASISLTNKGVQYKENCLYKMYVWKNYFVNII